MSEAQLDPIEQRNWKTPFFTIWTGQAISLFGSQLVQFALIWYLTQETGSATVLATATLVGMLPQIFIGPLAGSFVDRGNRRRIMMIADSSIALLTLVLAVLFATGLVQVWHIYAAMFLRSLGTSFHGPAMGASTSLMVPKRHLARVQGVNQTLNGGLNIVVAPLGALLLSILPMQGVLAIDIVTALTAVVPLFFVAVPQPPKVESTEKPSTFWEDFRAGFRYVFKWQGLLLLALMATGINFLLTPAGSLTPLLITKYFGGGAQELGWFEACFSAGVIAGGLLLGVWGGFNKRIYTCLLGIFGIGLFTLLVGLAPAQQFSLALIGMFGLGIMVPITNGSLGAIFQASVDPSMQGRVFTLLGSLATAATPLSLVFAGPLSDAFGVQSWYIAGGLVTLLICLLGFLNRSVTTVEAGYPGSAQTRVGLAAE